MLRPAFLALCLLCGLLSSAPARSGCVPHATSDGGSLCLPEGWRITPWDSRTEVMDEATEGTALKQQLMQAGRLGADGRLSAVVMARMALLDGHGKRETNYAQWVPVYLRSIPRHMSNTRMVLPPKEVRIGGRNFWRTVVEGPKKQRFMSFLCTVVDDALYNLVVTADAPDASGLPEMEALLVSGWTPGPSPIPLPEKQPAQSSTSDKGSVRPAPLPACTPFLMSDGGSICLYGAWESVEWDDSASTGRAGKEGDTIRNQIVFNARLPVSGGESLVLTAGRIVRSNDQGHVLAGFSHDAGTTMNMFERSTPSVDVLDARRILNIGGREFQRFVKKSDAGKEVVFIYAVAAADATYQFFFSGPSSRRAELERLAPIVFETWNPAPGAMKLAGMGEQEWSRAASKHAPGITLSLPASWVREAEQQESGLVAKGVPNLRHVKIYGGQDGTRLFGRAQLHIQTFWAAGSGGDIGEIDPKFAELLFDGFMNGLTEEIPLKLVGVSQDRIGPLTLHQDFYIMEKGYDARPSGLIVGSIQGPGRLITSVLTFENLDDASWRAFLPEMFRRWEFSPSELKALSAQVLKN